MTWHPPKPTKAPPARHEDGSRTSVSVFAIHEAAKVLDVSNSDPTKVVKALTKFVQDNQSCGLVDPVKRDSFFEWFHKYMHHSYVAFLDNRKPL